MNWAIILQLAKATGIIGVSIGSVVMLFSKILDKRLLPQINRRDATGVLKLIIILTFTIGALGIVAYVLITIIVPPQNRSAYEVESVNDIVDFTGWRASVPNRSDSSSGIYLVRRIRKLVISKSVSAEEDFVDRNTTTGKGITATVPNNDISFSEVTPKSGRTKHEYYLTLPSETFEKTNPYELKYELLYDHGWVSENDGWVGKVIQYPTFNYSFVLLFPSPWRRIRVSLQPPGSVDDNEVLNTENRNNSLEFRWSSPPKQILKPGTRIFVRFEWPPMTGMV